MSGESNERLSQLESVVEKWWGTTMEAARALHQIQEEDLYKVTHKRFGDYVAERWQKTRQWAHSLIVWYRVNAIAGLEADPLSINASKPLLGLKPAEIRRAIADATKAAKSEKRTAPTAKDIRRAVTKLKGTKPETPAITCAVQIGGTDLNLLRGKLGKVAETSTDDDPENMSIVVKDLAGFLRLLAKLAAKNGHLRVSLGIEEFTTQVAAPR